jgi:hypothetical protein
MSAIQLSVMLYNADFRKTSFPIQSDGHVNRLDKRRGRCGYHGDDHDAFRIPKWNDLGDCASSVSIQGGAPRGNSIGRDWWNAGAVGATRSVYCQSNRPLILSEVNCSRKKGSFFGIDTVDDLKFVKTSRGTDLFIPGTSQL